MRMKYKYENVLTDLGEVSLMTQDGIEVERYYVEWKREVVVPEPKYYEKVFDTEEERDAFIEEKGL